MPTFWKYLVHLNNPSINPDEEDEPVKDADEAEEEDTEEDKEENEDEEEGVNLNYDNPFSLTEEIKLSIDENYKEILNNEMQKAIKKHMNGKKDENVF